MRIESVTAHAFGPLAGETLELAPGLTVVAGVNESAKSSWHAALYAALCGRSRGAPTSADRRLVERYEPWDKAPWLLSAVVVLDDGRRLGVCQDLDGGNQEGGSRSRVVEKGEDGTTTDVGAEILRGHVDEAPSESHEVVIPHLRADTHVGGDSVGAGSQQRGRIAGVEPARDVGAGDDAQHGGVVAECPGAEAFAEIGVEVDTHSSTLGETRACLMCKKRSGFLTRFVDV